jgi:hypothetical protein
MAHITSHLEVPAIAPVRAPGVLHLQCH